MPNEIPLIGVAEQITLEWVDAVLAAAGVSPAGELEAIERAPVGSGYVGAIVRLSLTWRGDTSGPRSVIVKLASPDPTSRQAGLMTGTYAREVAFYRQLASACDLPIPACYGVAFDPASGDCVLVLEDLVPSRAGDQISGCDADEAAAALESLAGLHAPHQGRTELASQAGLAVRGRDSAAGLGAIYDALLARFSERYRERLAAPVLDAAARLQGRVGAWLAHDHEPHTLIHGDFRVENLLIGRPGARFRVAAVDWQTVGIAPAMADVTYFLGASLPTELRRKHEVDLLAVYRDAMAARGVALDRDDVWWQYRAQAFAGLHMAVVASQLVRQTEHGDEMFCVMAERHAAHALDVDAFDLLDE